MSPSLATFASYHPFAPGTRSFAYSTTSMRSPIFWPSNILPSVTTTPRRAGSDGAIFMIIMRCALSVVTTLASESLRMYSTSSLWSFGSIGTTLTPEDACARYASTHKAELGRIIAVFSSLGFSAKRVP